jgi:DNA-binding CsgD family transcriptional regulator
MRWQENALFVPMSPAAFAPFDGLEGLCALARDEQFRLLWCNDQFARELGARSEDLVGSTPEELMPARLAHDRKQRMHAALAEGRMVAFYQMWNGVLRHVRTWPLDPDAFGAPGYFIVMSKAVDAPPPGEGRAAILSRASDLGDLALLSRRELEVFYLLASGMTINQIASELFRSPKTIGRHAENIHKKMGYTNRAELVLDASRRGLLAFSSDEWADLIAPARFTPKPAVGPPVDRPADPPADPPPGPRPGPRPIAGPG